MPAKRAPAEVHLQVKPRQDTKTYEFGLLTVLSIETHTASRIRTRTESETEGGETSNVSGLSK